MRDRVWLAVYLVAVISATMVHDLRILAAFLLVAAIVGRRETFAIARRAGQAVLFFHAVVAISYTAIGLSEGNFSVSFLALITLRVFLLAFLTFLVQRRINLFRALSFSQTLAYVLALAYSQAMTFRRLLGESHMALRSRSVRRMRIADLYRHGAATATFLLGKALHDSVEITQAMTSRGFFGDSREPGGPVDDAD